MFAGRYEECFSFMEQFSHQLSEICVGDRSDPPACFTISISSSLSLSLSFESMLPVQDHHILSHIWYQHLSLSLSSVHELARRKVVQDNREAVNLQTNVVQYLNILSQWKVAYEQNLHSPITKTRWAMANTFLFENNRPHEQRGKEINHGIEHTWLRQVT